MKLSAVDETPRFLKATIYGRFGVGKTFQIGTCEDDEDLSPTLLMRAEDGALTISNREIVATPKIETLGQIEEILIGLRHRQKEWAPFKTVAVDSITALQQTVLQIVVEDNCKKNSNKDPNAPSIRDYGQATFIMSRITRQLFSLPMNVIVTALLWEQYDTDDEKEKMSRGPKRCGPKLPPAFRDTFCAATDHLWPLILTDNGKRQMIFQPTKPYYAKTRGAEFAKKLGAAAENPTLPQIMRVLRETQPTK